MMFDLLRKRREQRLLDRHPIDASLWASSVPGLPLLRGLSPAEAERLLHLTTLFLARKLFEPAQGLVLSSAMRLRIAAQACLPILNLGSDWYDGWHTLIIYPAQFIRPRSEIDDSGVMHEWSEVLSGESWDRGPVVLSWADIEASGHCVGYNVIIHEMAHKLDALNGAVDGFPPLHRTMSVPAWSQDFRSAFDRLTTTLARNEVPPIDAYAAESPAEFFAVISEYFFETPERVRLAYPAVFERLVEFYRQDPAARCTGQD